MIILFWYKQGVLNLTSCTTVATIFLHFPNCSSWVHVSHLKNYLNEMMLSLQCYLMNDSFLYSYLVDWRIAGRAIQIKKRSAAIVSSRSVYHTIKMSLFKSPVKFYMFHIIKSSF